MDILWVCHGYTMGMLQINPVFPTQVVSLIMSIKFLTPSILADV